MDDVPTDSIIRLEVPKALSIQVYAMQWAVLLASSILELTDKGIPLYCYSKKETEVGCNMLEGCMNFGGESMKPVSYRTQATKR